MLTPAILPYHRCKGSRCNQTTASERDAYSANHEQNLIAPRQLLTSVHVLRHDPSHVISQLAIGVMHTGNTHLLGLRGGGDFHQLATHSARNQANATAGGLRQSLTNEIHLTPQSQEVPSARTKTGNTN
jgi:hypothetical protein